VTDYERTLQFVDAVVAHFADSRDGRDGFDGLDGLDGLDCATLVALRAVGDLVVVLFRDKPQGGLRGCVWDLEASTDMYGGELSPQELALELISDDIIEPWGPGVRLHVTWADGLVDDPNQVEWQVASGESIHERPPEPLDESAFYSASYQPRIPGEIDDSHPGAGAPPHLAPLGSSALVTVDAGDVAAAIVEQFRTAATDRTADVELVAIRAIGYRIVIVYREQSNGPRLGTVLDVRSIAGIAQATSTASQFAQRALETSILPLTGRGLTLDVDWAHDLVEDPSDIEWTIVDPSWIPDLPGPEIASYSPPPT
jgi:hypothetical protein